MAGLVLALISLSLCLGAPAGWSHAAKTPAKLIKVRARIRIDTDPNQGKDSSLALRGIFFTPSVINVGTVDLIVSNTDNDDHWFEINGVKTGVIRGGGRASIRVTFKRPGIYPVAISNDDLGNVGPGELKVVK